MLLPQKCNWKLMIRGSRNCADSIQERTGAMAADLCQYPVPAWRWAVGSLPDRLWQIAILVWGAFKTSTPVFLGSVLYLFCLKMLRTK